MVNNPVIGIFDSGVGGFSVYKRVRKVTTANCIYYGDTLNAPYGNKEEAEIVDLIKKDIIFLQEKGVTHFVNACNSMSVNTTLKLLNECGVDTERYTDMIRAFEAHATFGNTDKVLIVATIATIKSGAYQKILNEKGVLVFEYAYEDLAVAIEMSASRDQLLEIIERSVMYANEVGATTILYACTHYPLVHGLFREVKEKINWQGEFVDPSMYVEEDVKNWHLQGEKSFCPYSSKDTPAFINNVIKFL